MIRRLITTSATVALMGAGLAVVGPDPAQAAAAPALLAAVRPGAAYHAVTARWRWSRTPTSYQLRVSANYAGTRVLKTLSVRRAHARPHLGLQQVTVRGLPDADYVYLQVRSIHAGAASSWSSVTRSSTRALYPAAVTASATPGPLPGEVTFHWRTSGANTTRYRIDTGLTMFGTVDPAYPKHARGFRSFHIDAAADPQQRSLTLTPEQTADAGAGLGTGNQLYYRFYAVDAGTASSRTRGGPLQMANIAGEGPSGQGDEIRIASFNVRTANEDGGTVHGWSNRVGLVAQEIIAQNPGIVALQELNPTTWTGASPSSLTQTQSLVDTLAHQGASRYQLVRSAAYIHATTGSQGERILYDSSRYTLLSNCPDTAQSSFSSPASPCTIQLPVRSNDTDEHNTRYAAYALFQDNASGQQFWFVSVHLDQRESTGAEGRSFEALRGQQAATTAADLDAMNPDNLPVIIAGDLNSWQNNVLGDAPHQALLDDGYYDTANALTQVDLAYPTVNHFTAKFVASPMGYAARFDVIMTKGLTGASRFANVLWPQPLKAGGTESSDHDMITADFNLP